MFFIDSETCTACGSCKDSCPCDAIEDLGDFYSINPDACLECGACYDTCEFGSIFEADDANAIPKQDV